MQNFRLEKRRVSTFGVRRSILWVIDANRKRRGSLGYWLVVHENAEELELIDAMEELEELMEL